MTTVGVAVAGLKDLGALVPVLEGLGAKHKPYAAPHSHRATNTITTSSCIAYRLCYCRYGVIAAHYDIVGQALLATLESALGDAWTPPVKEVPPPPPLSPLSPLAARHRRHAPLSHAPLSSTAAGVDDRLRRRQLDDDQRSQVRGGGLSAAAAAPPPSPPPSRAVFRLPSWLQKRAPSQGRRLFASVRRVDSL